jgi:hypothetical protein
MHLVPNCVPVILTWISAGHYGTAEAVPFVFDVFPQDFSGVKPVL